MTTLDTINGTFELFGGAFLALNCVRLHRDKQIKGVSVAPFVFYSAWGLWNLVYYPALHQTLSFVGGIGVVLANLTWVAMAVAYAKRGTKS